MNGNKHPAYWLAIGVCFVLPAWFGQSASGDVSLQSECRGAGTCVPNARHFGYFPRKWREWRDESRADKKFPQSISAEVLPTPKGTEELPLPKESEVPEAPPRGTGPPEGGLSLPAEPPLKTPVAEGILPPGKKIQIEEQPEMPTEPEPPLLEEPPAEEELTLPGMPAESESPSMPGQDTEPDLPGLPLEPEKPLLPKEDQSLPGLPLDGSADTAPDARWQKPADAAGAARSEQNAGLHREFWASDALEGTVDPPATSSKTIEEAAYETTVAPWAKPHRRPPENKQNSAAADPTSMPAEESKPADRPPLGLAGFCPVQLGERESWVPGDPQWTAVYQGRTYQFCGPVEREHFQSNPDKYAPVFSGFDPVLAVDENRHEPGRTDFCAVYNGRLYMFSNAVSLARFRQDTRRYAVIVLKQ